MMLAFENVLSNIDGETGFYVQGLTDGLSSGYDMVPIGDVNHDGFDDLSYSGYTLIPTDDIFPFEFIYESGIVFGGPRTGDQTLYLDTLDAARHVKLTDARRGVEQRILHIRGVGDINADGIDDFGVLSGPGTVNFAGSRPPADPFQALFLVHGRTDWNDSLLELDDFTASDGTIFDAADLGGEWTLIGDFVGGDVDGDGFQDVVVSWLDREPNGQTAGSWVDVFYGTSEGFGAVVDLDVTGAIDQHRFVSNVDRNIGIGFIWEDQALEFGGDINADGHPDLMIGGSGGSIGTQQVDENLHVVFGGNRPAAAETVLDSIPASEGLIIVGRLDPSRYNGIGGSVAFVGDVTGDGVDDFVVNNWQGSRPGFDYVFGGSFLIHGKEEGWDSGIIDLSSFSASDATELFADFLPVGGGSEGHAWVTSVSAAGDLNGDGINDFLFNASDVHQGGLSSPSIYAVFGGTYLNSVEAISRLEISGNIGVRMRQPEFHGGSGPLVTPIVYGDFDFDGDGNQDFIATSDSYPTRLVYNPTVTGVTAPDIAVTGERNGVIANGGGRLNLGVTGFLANSPTETVTITNYGTLPLILQPAELASGTGFSFPINVPPNFTLQPGESTTIVVQLDTDTVGEQEARVRLTSNDPNESPYEFSVEGEVRENAHFEVLHDDVVLPVDGGQIDFGSATQGDEPLIQTFTVRNNGTIAGLLGAAVINGQGFALEIGVPAQSLLPGETTTFSVRMNTDLPGERSGTLGVQGATITLTGAVTSGNIAPELQSLTIASGNLPNSSTVEFTATFSEAVSGVDATDFLAVPSGSVTTGVIAVSQVSSEVYEVTVNDVLGTGDLQLRLVDDRTIKDSAGQKLTGGFQETTPQTYDVGNRPVNVVAADLNSDGFPELITANFDSGDISLLLNNGDGTFAVALPLAIGFGVLDVAAGDIDNDGNADLLVVTLNGTITVFRGNGDLTYSPLSTITGTLYRSIDLVDMNRDGNLDLAYTLSNGSSVSVGQLLGAGDGTFGSAEGFGTGGSRLKVVYANTDAYPDLVTRNKVAHNGAAGLGFDRLISTERVPSAFDVGDIDQDGLPDFVYASEGLLVYHSAFLNKETVIEGAGQAFDLRVVDLNNDYLPDVLIADYQADRVRIFQGLSGGGLSAPYEIDLGASPRTVLTEDLDQDGRIDLIAVNEIDDEVSVVFGSGNGTSELWQVGAANIELTADGELLSSGGVLEFGTIQQAEAAAVRTLTIRNTSTSDLIVQPAEFVSGAGFSIAQNFAVDQTITPGAAFDLVVTLEAAIAGEKTALLQFTSNDPDQASIALTVTGSVVEPLMLSVTTTANSGPGSFRQAVLDANQSFSDVVIRFDIPETDEGFIDIDAASGLSGADPEPDVFVIKQTGGFFEVNNVHGRSVTIDGLTPGADSNPNGPSVVLDGSEAGSGGHGIIIDSSGVTIASLGFQNWASLALLTRSDNTLIQGNYFGVDGTGAAAAPNQRSIEVLNADGVVVDDNLISGATLFGISVTAASNVRITSNRIGTDASGTLAIPNGGSGIVVIDSTDTIIGGLGAEDGNVISGNGIAGVESRGDTAGTLSVIGNVIGLDATAENPIPNQGSGIEVNGKTSAIIGGSVLEAANTISGNAGAGIKVASHGTTQEITGNRIGTDGNGNFGIGNGGAGISIDGDSLGSALALIANNQISGNGADGINLGRMISSVLVEGNYIGTNATITDAIANAGSGILVRGPSVSLLENLVSGNDGAGILVSGTAAVGTIIENNVIGTNLTIDAAIANGGSGIRLTGGASNARIGSTDVGLANVVSGNLGAGINLDGVGISQHTVAGNAVGTDKLGSLAIGNGHIGIVVNGQQNIVEDNLIAFNGNAGIGIVGFDNQFSRNAIWLNDGLGIDVGADGVTTTVPPGLSLPEIDNVNVLATETQIFGSLTELPQKVYHIDLYESTANSAEDAEGERWLGRQSVTTDTVGMAEFNFVVHESIGVGRFLTATASTDSGAQSEFSLGVGAAQLNLFSSMTEVTESESIQITLSRNIGFSGELVVQLSSTDLSRLLVPTIVTLPADNQQITFLVTAIDDGIANPASSVSITAEALGYSNGTTAILVLPLVTGDLNRDGTIDAADFTTWQNNYGSTAGEGPVLGDSDHDYDVDGLDFLNWQRTFQAEAIAVASVSSTVQAVENLQAAEADFAASVWDESESVAATSAEVTEDPIEDATLGLALAAFADRYQVRPSARPAIESIESRQNTDSTDTPEGIAGTSTLYQSLSSSQDRQQRRDPRHNLQSEAWQTGREILEYDALFGDQELLDDLIKRGWYPL